jgi:hypothetical protein
MQNMMMHAGRATMAHVLPCMCVEGDVSIMCLQRRRVEKLAGQAALSGNGGRAQLGPLMDAFLCCTKLATLLPSIDVSNISMRGA